MKPMFLISTFEEFLTTQPKPLKVASLPTPSMVRPQVTVSTYRSPLERVLGSVMLPMKRIQTGPHLVLLFRFVMMFCMPFTEVEEPFLSGIVTVTLSLLELVTYITVALDLSVPLSL